VDRWNRADGDATVGHVEVVTASDANADSIMCAMPRTTVDLDGSILEELKRRQQAEGKTLSRLVSELLARALADEETEPPMFGWTSKPMGARVDLEDKDAVARVLDEP